jgi:hypothetical protein
VTPLEKGFRVKYIVLVLTVAGVPAYAHHSFPAFYFEDQTVSIEGALVAFEYRAPHAWVHVKAADADGRPQTFAAEWANPSRLSRENVTKDTLKIGDRVIVTGSPGRTPGEYKLHLKKIERPADGWKWETRRR